MEFFQARILKHNSEDNSILTSSRDLPHPGEDLPHLSYISCTDRILFSGGEAGGRALCWVFTAEPAFLWVGGGWRYSLAAVCRDRTHFSCIRRRVFATGSPGKPQVRELLTLIALFLKTNKQTNKQQQKKTL